MTRWVEDPTGGRDRGVTAMVRAFVEVFFRPTRFFRNAVAPGDQAPGLTFAMAVVLVEELVRIALVADPYPVFQTRPVLSGMLWLGAVVLLVTPAVLHLTAAATTLVLVVVARDRGGISETVQVIAYASAPCVFAGVDILEVRVLCGLYAGALLVLGMTVVHRTTPVRAVLAGSIPGVVAFGYGFRTIEAGGLLLRQWYVI
jgi:hypothetical protein